MKKESRNIIKKIKNKFIKKMMSNRYEESIQEQTSRQEFFYKAFKALKFNGITGAYAEFGCNGANTFVLAYRESKKHFYETTYWAFDSFQGLPKTTCNEDAHPKWIEGEMSTSVERFHEICAKNMIPREAYKIVEGFYNESLSKISIENEPKDISLAYIDCDLYSSTIDVLNFLIPRFKSGMIVAFDDYFCYSELETSGERKALLEKFRIEKKWSLVPYCNIGWGGMSFIVERIDNF